jgi:hypothetical protein
MEVTTFLWMMVVLKIPIAALLWLVWWAIQEPEPVVPGEDDGGSRRPDHPRGPSRPRPPRRGPHAGDPPASPPRVRTAAVGDRSRTSR